MPFWNPKHTKILYFHVCRKDDDYYIKVDTENKKVFKLVLNDLRTQGKYYCKGVYEIRWITFLSGYLYDLSKDGIDFKKICELKDNIPRTKVKYTTENQWLNALRILVIELTKT